MRLMLRCRGLVIVLAALALPGADRAWGESGAEPRAERVIRVTGEAAVAVEPDRAWLDLGVVTEARSAEAAARQNAARAEALLHSLRKVLGSEGEIRTTGYSVRPRYRYPREGGKPEIVGYTAANGLQVRTAQLDRVGALVDAGTAAGANQIRGLEFRVADEGAARAEALARAAAQARGKAEAIASSLGIGLTRVLRVEEVEGGRPPGLRQPLAMRAEAAETPTPIEAGALEVRGRVVLVAEIKD